VPVAAGRLRSTARTQPTSGPATRGGPAKGPVSQRLVRAVATLAVAAVVVILVLYPLGRLAVVVGTDTSGQLFGGAPVAEVLRTTVALALAVTAAAVPLGTLAALGLARSDVPGRRVLRVAIVLPLLVPGFVLGYSWTQAYGRGGFTEFLFGLPWRSVQGPAGVWAALVVSTVPVVYLLVAVGLAARAEPELARAARSSGAGPLAVLVHITLPLLRPSIAAAAVLSVVSTLDSFAIPQAMGGSGDFTTVTMAIYRRLSLGSDPAAFVQALALALLLVAATLVVVVPADLWLGPRLRATRGAGPSGPVAVPGASRPHARSTGTGMHARSTRTAMSRWISAGLSLYLVLALALPMVALLAAALTPAVGVPPTPAHWTLDNFRSVLNARSLAAFGRSAGLALLAAGLLTVLGAAVAVLERRRIGRALAGLVTVALVVPGSTVAVALLISYGRWLGGTLLLILLAYLAKLWALAHRPISGALDRFPPGELQAARASGAGLAVAVRTVAARPLAPALLGAFCICGVTALHEVTMSVLLYGPGTETLAVIVLNSAEIGQIGPTAALSLLLTGAVLLPVLALWPAIRRLRTR
jgi:iron(III) transport system permease protein